MVMVVILLLLAMLLCVPSLLPTRAAGRHIKRVGLAVVRVVLWLRLLVILVRRRRAACGE
jgi:hypothetical protein